MEKIILFFFVTRSINRCQLAKVLSSTYERCKMDFIDARITLVLFFINNATPVNLYQSLTFTSAKNRSIEVR